AGRGAIDLHDVRDPVSEHARLAAARARQDEQRAVVVEDGLALGLVQIVEKAVSSGGGGHPGEHRPTFGRPTLPRWACATRYGAPVPTSPRRHARCASTSTALTRSSLVRRPSSTPSATSSTAPQRRSRATRSRWT